MNDTTRYARVRQMARSGEARRIRVAAGVTQGEIGRDVGASACAVSRWEAGRRAPRGTVALRYLRILERLAAEMVNRQEHA